MVSYFRPGGERGGTALSKIKRGFNNYYNQIRLGNPRTQTKGKYSARVNSRIPTSSLVKLFQKDKPALVAGIFSYTQSGNGVYRVQSGHAIAVNGYESGAIKVYDPWGRIYNVKLGRTSARGLERETALHFVSGDSGFTRYNIKRGKPVILRQYDGVYTRNKS